MYREDDSVTVYSSEAGRICPGCGQAIARCACKRKTVVAAGDGIVRVSRSTKGRGGKCVTLITGVPLNEEGLTKLAKQLKQRCGTGGTVKDGVIEIQGDHRPVIVEALKQQGYQVKLAGG